MLTKQDNHKVQVNYHPKSGNAQGGMSVIFWQNGKVPLYVDLKYRIIKTFIPFKGKEEICWDCGRNRELIIETDFEGNFVGQQEVCDN